MIKRGKGWGQRAVFAVKPLGRKRFSDYPTQNGSVKSRELRHFFSPLNSYFLAMSLFARICMYVCNGICLRVIASVRIAFVVCLHKL